MQRLPPSRPSDLALLENTAALSDLVLDPALEHYGESGAESAWTTILTRDWTTWEPVTSAFDLRFQPSAPA